MADEKKFLAGIYARLSVDGTDKKNESVGNQIAAAKKYIDTIPDIEVTDVYTDLGVTGTSFERSGFQRMMSDIRKQKINCVVVKDFSRFGRNYIETGNYLEKIFPFLGVRFISVTDGYDSMNGSDEDRLGIHLKQIINEMYARDIAVRVESAKLAKLRTGSFVGGTPAYGYTKKTIGNRHVLVPEAGTNEVVLEIYRRYGSGMGMTELVKWLYDNKVHRPTEYRKTGHVYGKEGEVLRQWSETTLAGMLKNPVYVGILVQKQGKMEHPVIVEHAHEALVPEELFFRVRERMENAGRKENSTHGKGKENGDPFHGILFCGMCGRAMKRVCTAKGRYLYRCPGRGKIDGERCDCPSVSGETLEEVMIKAWKTEFFMKHIKEETFAEYVRAESEEQRKRLLERQKELRGRIEELDMKISGSYKKYRQGRMTGEEFQRFKRQQEIRRTILEKEAEKEAEKLRKKERREEQVKEILRGLIKGEGAGADAESIRLLTARMDVYAGKGLRLWFNFQKGAPEHDG